MPAWVVSIVISFVLRQIAKFTTKIDWKKLEADLDERIRKIFPIAWFDEDAIALVNTTMEIIKKVLGESDQLKEILELLAEEKFTTAVQVLIKLIKSEIGTMEFITLDQDRLKKLLPKLKL